MDNVTNLGTGTQGKVLFNVAYHTGYSLFNLIGVIKGNPELLQKAGINNYSPENLNTLYTQLTQFVQAFEGIQEKKVS